MVRGRSDTGRRAPRLAFVALAYAGALPGCLVGYGDQSGDGDGTDDGAGLDCGPTTAEVAWVFDGDTIELEGSGERVRYILVGAPEIAHDGMPAGCFGGAAKQRNIDLVAGQTVRLTYDAECRDRFDRLLAYVEVDGVDVNRTLIAEGLACVFQVLPNGRDRVDDYLGALEQAAAEDRGLWGVCPEVCQ